ncbi:MAG: hypothetical protein ABIZ80_03590 [Bryobacteraceae bacterium]
MLKSETLVERLRRVEERTTGAVSSPFGQQEGADLPHVHHGSDRWRPKIQGLESDEQTQLSDRDVNRLPMRKLTHVATLLLDRPRLIDG